MIIVLDTNIIVENWSFDKPFHRAFVDYVGKVNCEVVFPQIVWSEVRSLYCSQLKDALNKHASAVRNVEKFLVQKDVFGENFINVEQAYEAYSEDLLDKLLCGHHSIIEYPTDILPLLAEKAIARMKPFGNSGEEFRDAILWHSVLEIAQEYEDLNPVVFISKNTREFADENNKNVLHPELQYELSLLEDRVVLYYNSLEQFIKAHQEPIQHVDYKWIIEHLPTSDMEVQFIKYVNDRRESLMPYFQHKYNKFIFNNHWQSVRFKLKKPGLVYHSQDDVMYAYKNGDISLFVEFKGIIYFGSSYNVRPSETESVNSFIEYTGAVKVNHSNFSLGYGNLAFGFDVKIEFDIKDKSLIYNSVAFFSLNNMLPSKEGENGLLDLMDTHDDDFDLPF